MATTGWDDTVEQHRVTQRRVIQQATLDLAAERGVGAVAMVDVARRAGISRATLYKYYGGVEEILAAHMIDEVTREHRRLEQELADLEGPLDRLRAVLSHLLGYFAAPAHIDASTAVDPGRFSPAVASEVQAALAELHAMVRDLIVAAVDAGELRADLGVDALAEVFQHLLSAGRTMVVRGTVAPDDATELLMDLFVHGASGARSAR